MDANVLSGEIFGVIYHELGHTLHGAINNSKLPINYNGVKSSLYQHMSNNKIYVEQCMNYINQMEEYTCNKATEYFDQNMAQDIWNQLNNRNVESIKQNLRNCGYTEEYINNMLQTNLEQQYFNIRNSEIAKLTGEYSRETNIDAVSDIISSVFNGTKRFAYENSNGNRIYLGGDVTYAHSQDYFNYSKM